MGDSERYPLFQVSTSKFLVLSICSFGIYDIYWTHQQWKRIADATGAAISPFWRTFFSPIFNFALFDRIEDVALEHEIVVTWRPSVLATVILLFSFALRLPDPWSLIGLAFFAPIIPVQATVETVNDRVAATVTETRNDRYGAGGIATVVIGGLLLVLVIVGTFMPK